MFILHSYKKKDKNGKNSGTVRVQRSGRKIKYFYHVDKTGFKLHDLISLQATESRFLSRVLCYLFFTIYFGHYTFGSHGFTTSYV